MEQQITRPTLTFGQQDVCLLVSNNCYIIIMTDLEITFSELMLGQPIFPGDSGVDQLVEIIKVLGTPTREQIKEMNPNYTEFKFPQIKAHPWPKVSDINYISWLLFEYTRILQNILN